MNNPTSYSGTNPSRRVWLKPLLLFLGAFVLGGLVLPNLHISWREPNSVAQSNGLNVNQAPALKNLSPEEVYARAAQVAYKAVVNIDTTQRVRVRGFFDDFMDGPRYREATSEGSGVIIDKSGYILTNEHVVGAANVEGKKIKVTLSDGKIFDGTIVGADRTTDVALIKIEGPNLPVAPLGTVKGLVPGQLCVAIGNPLSLKFTVTHGVVSALGRPIAVENRVYPDLIQHDAGINPGNSGGALVNLQGQVIGINTLVDRRGQSIGFAIPIDTALRVADELKRFGKVKRPWLGLLVETNNSLFVNRFGTPDVAGVVVDIYPNGPAANSGLQRGDVLTAINGQRIRSKEDFEAAEKKLRIGQRIEIEVQRPGERGQGSLVVGEAP